MSANNSITAVLTVTGDKELVANLRALPEDMRIKILRPAARKAATIVARAARRLVPRRTGYLRRAIRPLAARRDASALVTMNRRVANAGELRGRARRPYRPAFIAHIVEYGSKNMAARPFLNPALAARREEALSVMAAEIRKRF